VLLIGVIKEIFYTVCMISIPYIRGISEKFKRNGETFMQRLFVKLNISSEDCEKNETKQLHVRQITEHLYLYNSM
jgi:hypothetical protein